MRLLVLALAAASAVSARAGQDAAVMSPASCSDHRNCDSCLQHDHCGWCFKRDQCTPQSECQVTGQAPWVTGPARCPMITQVSPRQLQRTVRANLTLNIENLPSIDGQLSCVFTAGDSVLTTDATRTMNGIRCQTPWTESIPPSPAGQQELVSRLSIRGAGADLASTDFTFFDCSAHKSCTQCVSSAFPCDWCIGRHYCTHDTDENCRYDILVSGDNKPGPKYRSGSGFCPRIDSARDSTNEILIPDGTKKVIRVQVHIIGQFIVQTRLLCSFAIDGTVRQVDGQLLGDTVYCGAFDFKYTSSGVNATVLFSVLMDGVNPLDNPNNVHIVMYRCSEMAGDEDACLALPEKYHCGWSGATSECRVMEQCALEWQPREHRSQH